MTKIIDIQLELLIKRLAEQKIYLELEDSAKEFLVRKGYDPAYGARPLKRALQKYVQDALAMKILEGAFQEKDTVVVSAGPDDDCLEFSRKN